MLKRYLIKLSEILFALGVLVTPSLAAFAALNNPTTTDAESAYLVQVMNQLDAMQPLILAAQKAQLPNKRVKFHYTHYQDSQGKTQNGLLEDVKSIKAGIAQYLNEPAIEPRIVQPLQGDYLNLKPVASDQSNLVSSTSTSNTAGASHADG